MAKKESRSESSIRQIVMAYRREAEEGKRIRERLVRDNWDAIHGRHDWSHKGKHQSKEWLPESAMALEQVGSFMKRALVDFGQWFSADGVGRGPTPVPPKSAELLMAEMLRRVDFPTFVADAIKIASVESLATAKIHGNMMTDRHFFAEPGISLVEEEVGGIMRVVPKFRTEIKTMDVERWQLAIDLVPFEGWFPDPRGRKLYEIHRVERDLHEFVQSAEDGTYDPEVARLITEDFEELEDESAKLVRTGQARAERPPFRKRVVLDECWGTLVNRQGKVLEKNIVTTIANEKYLARPPESNPFWHRKSPFVSEPLIRVPLSVWHKAILDHAVPLNRVMSELMNLILDEGFRRVWGLGQVRPDIMEAPEEISDGIPVGYSAVLKPGVPPGQQWYERVDTPGNPADALGVFAAIDRSHQKATAVPDIKLGITPPRQTTATAIVEAKEETAGIFDGIARDYEDRWIEKVLERVWETIWQHLDDLTEDELVAILGVQEALALTRMTAEQRFATMVKAVRFKVHGIRAVLNRTKDFQKLMALLELLSKSEPLAMTFQQQYSIIKLLAQLLKAIDIDPDSLKRDPNEPQLMPAVPGAGGNGRAALPAGRQPGAGQLPEEALAAAGAGARR